MISKKVEEVSKIKTEEIILTKWGGVKKRREVQGELRKGDERK